MLVQTDTQISITINLSRFKLEWNYFWLLFCACHSSQQRIVPSIVLCDSFSVFVLLLIFCWQQSPAISFFHHNIFLLGNFQVHSSSFVELFSFISSYPSRHLFVLVLFAKDFTLRICEVVFFQQEYEYFLLVIFAVTKQITFLNTTNN